MIRTNFPAGVVICTALQACMAAPAESSPAESSEQSSMTSELVQGQQADVITAACDISAAVADYRDLLGDLNPNVVGEQPGDRREINWDAVPGGNTNNDTFPGDFFNQPVTGRARGAVFSTDGTGFRVSDDNFITVNPDYAGDFNFFSPIRTFAAVGSNQMDVQFFVAGTSTPALSAGFGVVFSDVDHEGSAAIKLIAANGSSLGKYQAPACPSGFSFVGVALSSPMVARVEITSGKGALGSDADDVSDQEGPARDLVIMDDFIYGEPRALQR
jgi:hypothetical protein